MFTDNQLVLIYTLLGFYIGTEEIVKDLDSKGYGFPVAKEMIAISNLIEEHFGWNWNG